MSSEIFRDPTEGAKARRVDLLRRRRDELITTPHAVRRVFVARSARSAAAWALAACGFVMVGLAISPSLADSVRGAFPGENPAVLADLLLMGWVAGGLAFAWARARSEHRFIVAMSRYVLPTGDLDHDLERLSHEHPDAIAKHMAHRLEARSAAVPVLAAALMVPATVLYIACAIARRGWADISDLETAIVDGAGSLAIIAACGVIGAVVATRRFARQPAVTAVGVAATGAVGIAMFVLGPRSWLVGPAIVLVTLAVLARRLHRERVLLDANDPAGGSELFTLSGAMRAVRGQVGRGAAAFNSVRRRLPRWAQIGVLAVMAVWFVLPRTREAADLRGGSSAASINHAATVDALPIPQAELSAPMTGAPGFESYRTNDGGAPHHINRLGDGQLRITMDYRSGSANQIYGLGGLFRIPRGWGLRATVKLNRTGANDVAMLVSPMLSTGSVRGQGIKAVEPGGPAAWFVDEACDDVVHLVGMRVVGPDAQAQHLDQQAIDLVVEPVLYPAACSDHN